MLIKSSTKMPSAPPARAALTKSSTGSGMAEAWIKTLSPALLDQATTLASEINCLSLLNNCRIASPPTLPNSAIGSGGATGVASLTYLTTSRPLNNQEPANMHQGRPHHLMYILTAKHQLFII